MTFARSFSSIRSLQNIALLSACVLAFAPALFGQTEPNRSVTKNQRTLLEQDFLTGDWSGLRCTLHEHGLDVSGSYTGEVFGNATGGIRRGAVYDGLLRAAIDVDLEKLANWPGATANVTLAYPHGSILSKRYTGDIGGVSNIAFYNSMRLFEAWIQQALFEQRFSLRAGLIFADEEFGVSRYAALFLNGGFGPPVALTGNIPVPIYPISAPGVRLEVHPAKGWFGRVAVFDGNPAPGVWSDPSPNATASDEFNRHNTDIALRRSEGALFIGEIGYEFNQPDPAAHPCDQNSAAASASDLKTTAAPSDLRGFAGRYLAGFAYHTDTFSDIRDVTLGGIGSSLAPARAHAKKGDGAVYFLGEQEIWREDFSNPDRQTLGVFARATFAPADRNVFDFSTEAGLHYTGPFRGRDEDVLGIGVEYFDISERVADAMRRANSADRVRAAVPDYEAVVELTYNMKVAPWWSFQPDLQWILHPGGSDARDNALVLGVRSAITF